MAFPYEKEMRTIEYLFSLPLKDIEIFTGKALAAIVAGLGGLAFVMAMISGYVLVLNGHLIQWTTPFPVTSLLLTALVIAPMVVVMSVLIIVAVSGFVSSVRVTYMPTYLISGGIIGLSASVRNRRGCNNGRCDNYRHPGHWHRHYACGGPEDIQPRTHRE